MRVHPQSTRVLLEPIPEEKGAILTPEGNFKDEEGNERQQLCRWKVAEIGPGRKLDDGTIEPIPLAIGDEVIFDGRFGTRLEPTAWYGGKRLIVIEYGAVLAKIERADGEKVSQFTPPPKIVHAVPMAR